MTSNKYYDSDDIPELSLHHLGVYKEDQLEKNELKTNSMIELELARLCITQLEKEIELEKLCLQKCESSGQSEQVGIANTRYGLLVTGDASNRNQRQSVADTKGHFDSGYKARVSFANTSESDVTPYLCTEKSVERIQKQAAFAIVPVLVRNGEKLARTCAFLDSGSDASLITGDLAKRLNLEGEPKTILLRTLDNQSTIQCKEVQLEVSSLDSSSSFRIPNVWTVERLPMLRRTVPTTSQMTSWTHLKDISFPRVKDENVKLLIGCNAPSVHEIKEIRTGKPNEPFAVKTLFGSYGEPCKSNRALNHLSAKEELEDKFEQLYSTEFKDPFSRTISMSVEDRIALSAISNSVQRLNGHYQIALPWRHKHKLPNNRELAERRLSCLKGRLIRDKKLFQDYVDSMTRYVERDYAEKVNDNHSDGQIWYLLHHPVFHSKKPNKLRIVFDCAAHYAGTSLNKNLYSGPDLVNNLVDVFTRFRQRPVGFTADIEAMFH
ncbi:unnamed protein product [Schistosoma curassoni]|uniref:DUF1758 domain-containing protein n=1 Tax=Schistosoma curassoni TaxID=6186 RepID=A0A183JXD9_9TREM|nr:unnamed protein product [Schistosoma curassoni]